ncbi:MAG: hemin ABC transporter substrate-binding protein [Opitutales bacterium]
MTRYARTHARSLAALSLFLGFALNLQANAAGGDTPRIVTIGGAATEIVFALGQGEHVVARDMSSVYPPESQHLPEVGYVRSIAAEGVLSMRPEVIIATPELGPPPVLQQLKRSGANLLILPEVKDAQTLQTAVAAVGQTLGIVDQANALNAAIQADFKALKAIENTPSVVLFMQTPGSGSFIAGGARTKANAIIELAGGTNAASGHNGYQPLNPEALLVLNPDVILIATTEPDAARNHALAALRDAPMWNALPAVRQGHVHFVPLSKTLGFGPRLGEATRALNTYFVAAAAHSE